MLAHPEVDAEIKMLVLLSRTIGAPVGGAAMGFLIGHIVRSLAEQDPTETKRINPKRWALIGAMLSSMNVLRR